MSSCEASRKSSDTKHKRRRRRRKRVWDYFKNLKSKRIKSKTICSDRIYSDKIRSNKIRTKQVKTNQVKTNQYEANRAVDYSSLSPNNFMVEISGNSLNFYARQPNPNDPRVFYGSIPLTTLGAVPNPPLLLGGDGPNPTRPTLPYKVVYIDQPDYWWPLDKMAQTFYDAVDVGFNVLNICFLVNGEPADMASAWATQLNATNPATGKSYQEEILEYAHSKGAVVLVSTGGATETNYWNTAPEDYATTVSNFVKQNGLDGVDFDLEHFGPHLTFPNFTEQQTIDWVSIVTNKTREMLGDGAIITHAPQAPYLGKVGSAISWAGPLGGYVGVYLNAPSIDFFNIQCYNQEECYTSYEGIFVKSCNLFPESSFTDYSDKVPLDKLVLGKPMRKDIDAGSGYNTPEEIHDIIVSANQNLGWNAGVMTWQWPNRDSNNPPTDGKNIAGPWLDTVIS